jgi:KDO2-lipid IV(A) lauroyltransferase
MSKILYYFVLVPLSRLPLPLLYLISDLVYLLFLTVWPYREKIIVQNLRKSFPEKTERERALIKRKFYRHLADLLAEGIKNLGISKNELLKRMKVENPEIMDQLAENKRNALLVGAHYGNWEWLITAQAFLFKQHAIGLGKPLSDTFLNEKINKLRGRFGMVIVNSSNYRDMIGRPFKNSFAMLTLCDQSPGDSLKSYWTTFLNQPTAALFGPEQMAHAYDLAIVYFRMKKVKRGFYTIHLELICDSPKVYGYGQITETYTRLLEGHIKECPELWLWSHKRWKREIPDNLETLMDSHRKKFEAKFGEKPHRLSNISS